MHISKISAFGCCVDSESINKHTKNLIPYHAGPKERDAKRLGPDNILAMKILDPARTGWFSAFIFKPKKDIMLRFSNCYRKMSFVTSCISYWLLWINEPINYLNESQAFLFFVANRGDRQLRLHMSDKLAKGIFLCHGPSRLTHIPFAFKAPPVMFQCAMDITSSSVKWQSALVCLDDNVLFSSTLR